jgi:hypothetical protein
VPKRPASRSGSDAPLNCVLSPTVISVSVRMPSPLASAPDAADRVSLHVARNADRSRHAAQVEDLVLDLRTVGANVDRYPAVADRRCIDRELEPLVLHRTDVLEPGAACT